MKNIRKIALSVLFFLTVFALVGCSNQNRVRVGTGGIGGNYYAYGSAMAPMAEEVTGKTFTVKATAGSAANLRLLDGKYLEMAIVQSDTLRDAYNGTGTFEDYGKCTGYSAVAGLYIEDCQVVVSAESGIESIEDLYGKRVSLGEKESGVLQNAEQILMVYGLNKEMVDASYLSFADSAKKMKEGGLDAFFCTASAPTTAVSELARQMDIKILTLDDNAVKKLVEQYDGYSRCIIKAGTYIGQDEDVVTVGVKAVLVASDKMDADMVEDVLECLFEHSAELSFAVGGTEVMDLNFATEDIPIPFHKGAISYYKNRNVNVSEKENTRSYARRFEE